MSKMDNFLLDQLPDEIDLDGRELPDGNKCIGKAVRVEGRTYRCLAKVGEGLAVVEVTLVTPREFGIDLGDE